ncbi:MAG: class I SAM-dependent methyltransferase [candidate division NC10 bacterium]|nr:class I SAM-dependent methyltransferase [candidate division NC10 bacterium]MDE2320347.1 class I SAM-dependent methyltransferase [candidate division NC10 bacterium]
MHGQSGVKQIRAVQIAHHAGIEVPDFPRIEKVVRNLRHLPSGKHLEVGYSKGGFADSLSKIGWDCTGLDLNAHDQAVIKTIECDLNEGFPVEAEEFDLVTAGEVIEHMLDEGAFLDECRRVLRKGGTLVVTTPNLSYSLNRLRVLIGKTPLFVYAPYHYHFHTRQTLVGLMEKHEFSVTKVLSSHVLYSRRMHWTGRLFEFLGDVFPTLGAHLIVFAVKS